MKISRLLAIALFSIALVPTAFAQDDETRQSNGLPMLIGEQRANLSGRIKLEGVDRSKPLPVITVLVTFSGGKTEKTTANSDGFYIFRGAPRENFTLVVEADGVEAVRQQFIASVLAIPRFDFTITWKQDSAATKPSVISAGQSFSRTAENEVILQNALIAMKAGEKAKAIELFNKMLASEPKDFVAWTELGTLYFRNNSLDDAEACYFKAIELKKDYFVALLNLGKLYFSRKKFDDAIVVLSNAVKSEPESADGHHFLGESYLQIKKGSLAVVELNQAIKLAPDEKADLHLRLAALYDAANLKPRAAEEYKQFLTKRPDYKERSKLEKYIADNPQK